MPLTPFMDTGEVIVASDSENHTSNCTIYDLKTESVLASFKEGHSVPRGLCFIGYDHLISAFDDKAVLKVWKVSNKNLEEDKMMCAGKVSCLVVTNCGHYCAAGIGTDIHFWDVQTGDLLAILSEHSQNVTNLKFTSDGYYLISGGKDGLVLVWRVAHIINFRIISYIHVKPRFTWMDHAGEVTDIYVGRAGQYARVATASTDMTCKIYELDSGNIMTSVSTDYPITAIAMDCTESFLILGSNEGNLYRINLWEVRDGECVTSETTEGTPGHSAAITCLSVSITGKYLLSGSDDGTCKVWDLFSFSCLKKLKLEGRVTNAFITLLPPGLRSEGSYETRLTVSNFKRVCDPENSVNVTSKIKDTKLSLFNVGAPDECFLPGVLNYTPDDILTKSTVSLESLKTINRQLYSYALADTMNNAYEENLSD